MVHQNKVQGTVMLCGTGKKSGYTPGKSSCSGKYSCTTNSFKFVPTSSIFSNTFSSPPVPPSNASIAPSAPASDLSAAISLMTNAVNQGNANTTNITDALQRTTTQFADVLQKTIQRGVEAQVEEN